MYDFLYPKRKTLWGLIIILIVVMTHLAIEIVNSQFRNQLLVEVSDLLMYLLVFMVIVGTNFFNYIYIKIMFALFNIDRTDLMIWLYSVAGMLCLMLLQPLSPSLVVKSIIKLIIFNASFQQRKWSMMLFMLSSIVIVIDVLMALLFQWG